LPDCTTLSFAMAATAAMPDLREVGPGHKVACIL
jgi:hypothetical protein